MEETYDEISEIFDKHFAKIEEREKIAREKDIEEGKIHISVEDLGYWKIYDIEGNSIGIVNTDWDILQDYIDGLYKAKRTVFYNACLKEVQGFCNHCTQNCSDCAMKEYKDYLYRRI